MGALTGQEKFLLLVAEIIIAINSIKNFECLVRHDDHLLFFEFLVHFLEDHSLKIFLGQLSLFVLNSEVEDCYEEDKDEQDC